MIRVLQSPAAAAVIGTLLYLGTTAAWLSPAKFAGARKDAEAKFSPDNSPSWRFRNPEFEQWLAELKHEKEALALREQELRELQTRLEAERAEILSVTQAVQRLEAEFDKNVVRFKAQEIENVKRQVKIVSEMSPEGAAAMLNEMPDDQIIRIIFLMKADVSGGILDALSKMGKTEAARAATLADLLRRALPDNTPSKRS